MYNDSNAYDDNYYAFYLCQVKPLYPKEAFYILHRNKKKALTDIDRKLMIKLHNRFIKYEEIAKLLGLHIKTVKDCINKYEK
jgi:DNA invertase Pin-like site-specific DNA recombinase